MIKKIMLMIEGNVRVPLRPENGVGFEDRPRSSKELGMDDERCEKRRQQQREEEEGREGEEGETGRMREMYTAT
jgi:hypothetical protein